MPSFREVATGKKDKKLEELHPPMAPPRIDESEQYSVRNHYDDAFESLAHATPKPAEIDFEAIARSSEFKRFIYYLFTGKVHRGSLQKLDRDIKVHRELSEEINKFARGSHMDYREVMKELKEKLKEVKQE